MLLLRVQALYKRIHATLYYLYVLYVNVIPGIIYRKHTDTWYRILVYMIWYDVM